MINKIVRLKDKGLSSGFKTRSITKRRYVLSKEFEHLGYVMPYGGKIANMKEGLLRLMEVCDVITAEQANILSVEGDLDVKKLNTKDLAQRIEKVVVGYGTVFMFSGNETVLSKYMQEILMRRFIPLDLVVFMAERYEKKLSSMISILGNQNVIDKIVSLEEKFRSRTESSSSLATSGIEDIIRMLDDISLDDIRLHFDKGELFSQDAFYELFKSKDIYLPTARRLAKEVYLFSHDLSRLQKKELIEGLKERLIDYRKKMQKEKELIIDRLANLVDRKFNYGLGWSKLGLEEKPIYDGVLLTISLKKVYIKDAKVIKRLALTIAKMDIGSIEIMWRAGTIDYNVKNIIIRAKKDSMRLRRKGLLEENAVAIRGAVLSGLSESKSFVPDLERLVKSYDSAQSTKELTQKRRNFLMLRLIPLRTIDLLVYEHSISRNMLFEVFHKYTNFPVWLIKAKEKVDFYSSFIAPSYLWKYIFKYDLDGFDENLSLILRLIHQLENRVGGRKNALEIIRVKGDLGDIDDLWLNVFEEFVGRVTTASSKAKACRRVIDSQLKEVSVEAARRRKASSSFAKGGVDFSSYGSRVYASGDDEGVDLAGFGFRVVEITDYEK